MGFINLSEKIHYTRGKDLKPPSHKLEYSSKVISNLFYNESQLQYNETNLFVIINYNLVDITYDNIELSYGKTLSVETLKLHTDGDYFQISGYTFLDKFNSLGKGMQVTLHFQEGCYLYNSAYLILPDRKDLIVNPSHVYTFVEYEIGKWELISSASYNNGGGGGGSNNDPYAIHVNKLREIKEIQWKDTLELGDLFVIEDSNNYFAKRSFSAANIKIADCDTSAIHLFTDNEYGKITRKYNPINQDRLLIENSELDYQKSYIEIGDIPLVTNDPNAIHKNGIDEFDTIVLETNISPTDLFLIEKSSDGSKRKVTFSSIPTAHDADAIHVNIPNEIINIDEKTSNLDSDYIVIEQDSDGTKKKVKLANLPTTGGGEVNYGMNIGIGRGVYAGKDGSGLKFRNFRTNGVDGGNYSGGMAFTWADDGAMKLDVYKWSLIEFLELTLWNIADTPTYKKVTKDDKKKWNNAAKDADSAKSKADGNSAEIGLLWIAVIAAGATAGTAEATALSAKGTALSAKATATTALTQANNATGLAEAAFNVANSNTQKILNIKFDLQIIKSDIRENEDNIEDNRQDIADNRNDIADNRNDIGYIKTNYFKKPIIKTGAGISFINDFSLGDNLFGIESFQVSSLNPHLEIDNPDGITFKVKNLVSDVCDNFFKVDGISLIAFLTIIDGDNYTAQLSKLFSTNDNILKIERDAEHDIFFTVQNLAAYVYDNIGSGYSLFNAYQKVDGNDNYSLILRKIHSYQDKIRISVNDDDNLELTIQNLVKTVNDTPTPSGVSLIADFSIHPGDNNSTLLLSKISSFNQRLDIQKDVNNDILFTVNDLVKTVENNPDGDPGVSLISDFSRRGDDTNYTLQLTTLSSDNDYLDIYRDEYDQTKFCVQDIVQFVTSNPDGSGADLIKSFSKVGDDDNYTLILRTCLPNLNNLLEISYNPFGDLFFKVQNTVAELRVDGDSAGEVCVKNLELNPETSNYILPIRTILSDSTDTSAAAMAVLITNENNNQLTLSSRKLSLNVYGTGHSIAYGILNIGEKQEFANFTAKSELWFKSLKAGPGIIITETDQKEIQISNAGSITDTIFVMNGGIYSIDEEEYVLYQSVIKDVQEYNLDYDYFSNTFGYKQIANPQPADCYLYRLIQNAVLPVTDEGHQFNVNIPSITSIYNSKFSDTAKLQVIPIMSVVDGNVDQEFHNFLVMKAIGMTKTRVNTPQKTYCKCCRISEQENPTVHIKYDVLGVMNLYYELLKKDRDDPELIAPTYLGIVDDDADDPGYFLFAAIKPNNIQSGEYALSTTLSEFAGYQDAIINLNFDSKQIKRLGEQAENLAMGGYKITGLGEPTENQDVATKYYVDNNSLDLNAVHVNISNEINQIIEKVTANANDIFIIEDSEDSFSKKRIDITAISIDDISDGTNYKKFTITEKNKLAGIENGADITDQENVTLAENLIPVNAHSDITSNGADIEDAVSKKHIQGTDTSLGVQTENADWGGYKITNVGLPENDDDVTNKQYVDYFIDAASKGIDFFKGTQNNTDIVHSTDNDVWDESLSNSSLMNKIFDDSLSEENKRYSRFCSFNKGNGIYCSVDVTTATIKVLRDEEISTYDDFNLLLYNRINNNYTSIPISTNNATLNFKFCSLPSGKIYFISKEAIETVSPIYEINEYESSYNKYDLNEITQNEVASSIEYSPIDQKILVGTAHNPDKIIYQCGVYRGTPGNFIQVFSHSIPIGSSLEIRDFCRYSMDTLFFLMHTTVSGVERDSIFKSINDGKTWEFVNNYYYNFLYLVNIGDNTIIGITENTLQKSIDECLTFEEIFNITGKIHHYAYIGHNTLIIVGEDENGYGKYWITYDNCKTFIEQSFIGLACGPITAVAYDFIQNEIVFSTTKNPNLIYSGINLTYDNINIIYSNSESKNGIILKKNFFETDFASDPDAFHFNESKEFNSLEEKVSLHENDLFVIEDSEDNWRKKRTNLGSFTDDINAIHVNKSNEINQISEKSKHDPQDVFVIEDSKDSLNKKKTSIYQDPAGSSYFIRSFNDNNNNDLYDDWFFKEYIYKYHSPATNNFAAAILPTINTTYFLFHDATGFIISQWFDKNKDYGGIYPIGDFGGRNSILGINKNHESIHIFDTQDTIANKQILCQSVNFLDSAYFTHSLITYYEGEKITAAIEIDDNFLVATYSPGTNTTLYSGFESTWNRIYWIPTNLNYYISSFCYTSDKTLLAIVTTDTLPAFYNTIYSSDDNGSSWSEHNLPDIQEIIVKVINLGNDELLYLTHDNSSHSYIYKKYKNYDINDYKLIYSSTNKINDIIYFGKGNVSFCGGSFTDINNNIIGYSNDRGETWIEGPPDYSTNGMFNNAVFDPIAKRVFYANCYGRILYKYFDKSSVPLFTTGTLTPDIGFYMNSPDDAVTGYANCLYKKGNFTKINNIVWFSIDINMIDFGPYSTYVCITGLPFIPSENTAYSSISYRLVNSPLSNSALPVAFINTNSNKIVLGYNELGDGIFYKMSVSVDLKNNSEFHLSGHYFTDE